MQLEQYEKIAEAILFAGGEPVEQKVIAAAMELDEEAAAAVLESLRTKYEKFESSVQVLRLENQWQLCTRKEYEPYIRSAFEIKRNAPLSQAAMEVLAVVAYNQPVTKSFVEQVRGVDCSGVMATLCQKGLIEEKGRLDLPGRPLLYGTTPEFLKCFSVSSLDELPELPEREDIPKKQEIPDQLSLNLEVQSSEEQAEE